MKEKQFYNFKVSLYSWQRGANAPILWRLPILPTPSFSNFVHPLPPLPCCLQPHPHCSFCCLLYLAEGWSCHISCAIDDNMDLHMPSLVTLVSEGPWCVFYATRSQVYWGLTHVVFYWYSDLISHTQTHKYTQHTQGLVHWHSHLNIYLNYLLCAHSSYFYYIKWIIP